MPRSLLINIHLYAASFFAPIILMMACSGGLYLLGIKGNVTETAIDIAAGSELNFDSPTIKQEVADLLAAAGEPNEFEYIKRKGATAYTRPTSRQHYKLTQTDTGVSVSRQSPDVQARLMELHMGHGPVAFKTFQKFMAAGLLLVLLSGVWLGLSSKKLRVPTGLATISGIVLFVLLGFIL